MNWNNYDDSPEAIREASPQGRIENVIKVQMDRLNWLTDMVINSMVVDEGRGLNHETQTARQLAWELSSAIHSASQFLINDLDDEFNNETDTIALINDVAQGGDSRKLMVLYEALLNAKAYDRIK